MKINGIELRVGDWVKNRHNEELPCEIIFLGKSIVVLREVNGSEGVLCGPDNLIVVPAPKKKKRVAPAVYYGDVVKGIFSGAKFRTEQEAKDELGDRLILWPYGEIIEIDE